MWQWFTLHHIQTTNAFSCFRCKNFINSDCTSSAARYLCGYEASYVDMVTVVEGINLYISVNIVGQPLFGGCGLEKTFSNYINFISPNTESLMSLVTVPRLLLAIRL